MTISVSLISSWTSFLMDYLVMYIWWSSPYIKRLSDSAYTGRWFWNRFHTKGIKEEPFGDPLVCSLPCEDSLVCSFHELCTSCKFIWFLLSSKKDRLRFMDASGKLYALRFWIIKAGYSGSNVLLIWIQSLFPSYQQLFSNPQQALLKLSRNNVVFCTRPFCASTSVNPWSP